MRSLSPDERRIIRRLLLAPSAGILENSCPARVVRALLDLELVQRAPGDRLQFTAQGSRFALDEGH